MSSICDNQKIYESERVGELAHSVDRQRGVRRRNIFVLHTDEQPEVVKRPIRNDFGHSRAGFLEHFINLLKGAVRSVGSFLGRVRLLLLAACGHPLRDRSFP